MNENKTKVLIMAAGTGGHVFPALAVAHRLQEHNAQVDWMVSKDGMERRLLAGHGIPLHPVPVSGLRDKGVLRLLVAPWMLLRSLLVSIRLLRRLRPSCVLGMGGYISGPGGIAARLLGIPLLLHDQNAVPGLTNRLLYRHARLVLETFPNTFDSIASAKGKGKKGLSEGLSEGLTKVRQTGLPIRAEIASLHSSLQRDYASGSATGRELHLLVLGGSLGAKALNRALPKALAHWPGGCPLHVWHQTGDKDHEETQRQYAACGLDDRQRYRIEPFIEDMAAAYTWADFALCRAGASTLGELTVARLPALLVPYPHHRDQQQLHNAKWMCRAGAAWVLQQHVITSSRGPAQLCSRLQDMAEDRQALQAMSAHTASLAAIDADKRIAQNCLEVARG